MIKYILVFLIIIGFLGCGGSDSIEEIENVPPENMAPTTPSLVYPTNQLLCTDNPLDFSWNASTDAEGDPISYEIQVATDDEFKENLQVSFVNTSSANITLLKGMTYYWRVKAKDSKNASSEFSSDSEFSSQGEGVTNHIPFVASLSSPLLDETVFNASTTLKWTASDADADLLSYDVYFGSSNPPEMVAEDISETTFNVNLESTATRYYWKIVVQDDKGGEALGQIWFFNTK